MVSGPTQCVKQMSLASFGVSPHVGQRHEMGHSAAKVHRTTTIRQEHLRFKHRQAVSIASQCHDRHAINRDSTSAAAYRPRLVSLFSC